MIEAIDNFIDNLRDKKYVVYYSVNMSNGRYDKYYLTEKELYKFILEYPNYKIEIYKISDIINLKHSVSINDIKLEIKEVEE